METPRLLLLSSLKPSEPIILPLPSTTTRNPNLASFSSNLIIHCTKKPPPRNYATTTSSKSSNSYWGSNAETFRSDRFKFKFEDESIEEEEDDDDDYNSDTRFRWRENRKRKWWSDGDDYSQQGNGVIEDVIDNVWLFKVLRSFGWLLPAIIVSMLLATGPKAFLMALALPLGQSAVSFAIDKVFGRTRDRTKPRPRTKRKPFSRTASSVEINEEELDESSGTGEGRQGYQSWVATDNGSVQPKVDQRKPGFGGWDELDKGTTRTRHQTTRGQGLEKGKMSRRKRNRDTPLLLRLLIAVFPFLGSWTRLL